MLVRVVTVVEGKMPEIKQQYSQDCYLIRTHQSLLDKKWKLSFVKKSLADSWGEKTVPRMITLASLAGYEGIIHD
jgi:hypothetical protein